MAAQVAPIYAMLTGDYNEDGNLDVLLAGNAYGTEASTGRYDALTGLLLAGNGKGHFQPLSSAYTGFTADGDVKAIAQVALANGTPLILVGNNSGPLQSFQLLQKRSRLIPVNKDDVYAIIQKKNGKTYRQEFYYGSNYLSQTTRNLCVGPDATHITFFDNQGHKREQKLNQP